MHDPENTPRYQHFDTDAARQHLQGVIDQASVVLNPDGMEMLSGVWEDDSQRIVLTFQRDFGSAFDSVVVVLDGRDAAMLMHGISELLEAFPNPD